MIVGTSVRPESKFPPDFPSSGSTIRAKITFCNSYGTSQNRVHEGRVYMRLYNLEGNCPSVLGSNYSENCMLAIEIPFHGTFESRFEYTKSWNVPNADSIRDNDCVQLHLPSARGIGKYRHADFVVPEDSVEKIECPQVEWPFRDGNLYFRIK
ncbi:MAG: hypothetical protein HYY56_06980 [Candidatus Omnitrophica bacterium]|nr:hypothetical protein [Candidatus Omnitrophota bacterium]